MTDRKKDHIELAFQSQADSFEADHRFYYEPLLSAHKEQVDLSINFAGKKMKIPVWVSSMTGGTKEAETINRNLAKACQEFGMGMGLGSCRLLLQDDQYLHQFDMRSIIGNDLPFYANLGIAQVEELIHKKETGKINELIHKLKADGLFIHVNPVQEYLQPEGDRFTRPAIETISELLESLNTNIFVKEVGQGMGPESLLSLMNLPLSGIEFGAYGGTNFATIELLRSDPGTKEMFEPLSRIGHTAEEMVEFLNEIKKQSPGTDKQLIISGGIRSFLDGYYYISKSQFPAVYGQASAMLKYAREDYDILKRFVEHQVKGLELAFQFLRIKDH